MSDRQARKRRKRQRKIDWLLAYEWGRRSEVCGRGIAHLDTSLPGEWHAQMADFDHTFIVAISVEIEGEQYRQAVACPIRALTKRFTKETLVRLVQGKLLRWYYRTVGKVRMGKWMAEEIDRMTFEVMTGPTSFSN